MKLSFKGEVPKRAAIVVVVLALVASVVAGREKPSLPAPEPAARIDTKIEPPDIDVDKLVRGESLAPSADPFASRSFGSSQAAPGPSAQAPAKPAAPPLPFKYVGKMIDEGKLVVFLNRGNENYSIESPQKIDSEYRVDSITELVVRFTYLPLGTRQTLMIN